MTTIKQINNACRLRLYIFTVFVTNAVRLHARCSGLSLQCVLLLCSRDAALECRLLLQETTTQRDDGSDDDNRNDGVVQQLSRDIDNRRWRRSTNSDKRRRRQVESSEMTISRLDSTVTTRHYQHHHRASFQRLTISVCAGWQTGTFVRRCSITNSANLDTRCMVPNVQTTNACDTFIVRRLTQETCDYISLSLYMSLRSVSLLFMSAIA